MKRVLLCAIVLMLNGVVFSQSEFSILELKKGEKPIVPPILQLKEGQSIQSGIDELAAAVREKMSSAKTNQAPLKKPFRIFSGDKKVAVAAIYSQEKWTVGLFMTMKKAYDLINLDRIYLLVGSDGHEETLDSLAAADERVVLAGAYTKDNLANLVAGLAGSGVEQFYFSLHNHGASIVPREGLTGQGGYTCTPISVISDLPPALQKKVTAYGFEAGVELGILRADNLMVVPLKGMSSKNYVWRIDEFGRDKVKIFWVRFMPGYFFTNWRGQTIAQIQKEVFYAAGSDSLNEFEWNFLARDPQILFNLQPRGIPGEVADYAPDIDANGVKDIPFAFLAGSDTLLAVDMNLGYPYVPFDLSENGVDWNDDGFIGGQANEQIDFNGNGRTDELVYIPTAVRMGDNSFLTDLELQEILAVLPESATKVITFHFCHCGGFADYMPPNSLFFASVPQNQMAAATLYPLDKFGQILAEINAQEVSWLEVVNYTIAGFGREEKNGFMDPKLFLFKDNSALPAAPGPWPNGGQGRVAEQFMIQKKLSAAAERQPLTPAEFFLEQNYPNPFNPETAISYALARAGKVKLAVYDLLGREVATLINEQQNPGEYKLVWRAGNLPSGIYFAILTSKEGVRKTKMTLVR
jgi:hypothetical protein